MSSGNGTPKESPILSLNALRKLGKANDFITHKQCADLVAVECSKIHEFYLNQVPAFTARMIQDALMSFGLIKLQTSDIAPKGEAVGEETPAAGLSAPSAPVDVDTGTTENDTAPGTAEPSAGVPCE